MNNSKRQISRRYSSNFARTGAAGRALRPSSGDTPSVKPSRTPTATPQPPTEANVGSIVYQNGVYYLVAVVSAPGTISDDVVLKLMVGQDMKYQEAKAQLGF